MANFDLSYIIKAVDGFSGVFEKLKANLHGEEEQLNSLQKKCAQMANSFRQIGSNLVSHVTLPLIGMATYAAKTYANFEDMHIKLKSFTTSAKDLERVSDITHKLSTQVPFPQEQITAAATSLLGAGVPIDALGGKLLKYSTIAKVSGEDVEQFSHTLGILETRGWGNIRMLRPLGAGGIRIVQELRTMAHEAGLSDAQFAKLSNKKLAFSMLEEAINRMTKAGTQFSQSTEEMFNTPLAQMGLLHNQMRNYIDDLVNSLVNTNANTSALKRLNEYLRINEDAFKEWLKNNPDILKMAVGIGAIAAAIGPLMILGALFLAIISPVTLIGIGVGAIIYAVYKLYELFKTSGKEILNTLLNCILHPFELARKEIELIIELGKKFFGLFSGESVKVPLIQTYGISAPIPQQPQGINSQTLFGGAGFGGNLASINSGGIAKASVGIDMHIVDKGKNVGSVASKTSGLNYFNTDLGNGLAVVQ